MKRIFCSSIIIAAILPAAAVSQPYKLDAFDHGAQFQFPPHIHSTRIKYGPRSWQAMTLYSPSRSGRPAPIIVSLSGASWPNITRPYPLFWLANRLTESGYAYVEIDQDPTRKKLDDVLADITQAIASIREQSAKRNLDPDRIVLVGANGNAHLAALLGTNESYFINGGIPFAALSGVVMINGDGFDIPKRVATAGSYRAREYKKYSGTDVVEQARLSPVNHLDGTNAPEFLFLIAENESTSISESKEMSDALSGAQVRTQTKILPQFREGSVSTYFLAEKGGAGDALLDFIALAVRGK